MNNLEKIQKAMEIFEIIAKIVMVFSFVAIAFTLAAGSVSLMANKLPFGELLQRLRISINMKFSEIKTLSLHSCLDNYTDRWLFSGCVENKSVEKQQVPEMEKCCMIGA